MGWTKRQLINEAYAEIGYADYEFDLEPEQLQMALRRLDAMVASWAVYGIRLGYLVPGSPESSDLDSESGLSDMVAEAVYTNLATRLTPPVGKQIHPDTRKMAREGYRLLLKNAALPPEKQLPETMPRGAGNKPWNLDDAFVDEPQESIDVGRDGPLDF